MATKDDNRDVTNSNISAAKAAAFEHIAGIGKTEGAGARARVDLAEYVCQQARDGVFEPEDAAEAWTRMSEASLKEQDEVGGSEQTTRQRISDIKHFIVLGNNREIDGPALLTEFKGRMAKIRSDRTGAKGRVWPMMLKFAQQQSVMKSSLSPKKMDELCALPPPPKAPKRIDKLWRIREALNAANERVEDKRIQQAITLIDETVAAMGGTKKQKDAQKKAEKAAREKAKKAEAKAKAAAKKASKADGTTNGRKKVSGEL
jgi:hypothetical protein